MKRIRQKKKILIIDNASNDGSIEEVVKEYPEVECVMLDKNYGFCRAVNIGIEKTDTAYVILLNNDTVIKDNYVKYLLDSIKKDPNIFSVEPKMIQYHESDPKLTAQEPIIMHLDGHTHMEKTKV